MGGLVGTTLALLLIFLWCLRRRRRYDPRRDVFYTVRDGNNPYLTLKRFIGTFRASERSVRCDMERLELQVTKRSRGSNPRESIATLWTTSRAPPTTSARSMRSGPEASARSSWGTSRAIRRWLSNVLPSTPAPMARPNSATR